MVHKFDISVQLDNRRNFQVAGIEKARTRGRRENGGDPPLAERSPNSWDRALSGKKEPLICLIKFVFFPLLVYKCSQRGLVKAMKSLVSDRMILNRYSTAMCSVFVELPHGRCFVLTTKSFLYPGPRP